MKTLKTLLCPKMLMLIMRPSLFGGGSQHPCAFFSGFSYNIFGHNSLALGFPARGLIQTSQGARLLIRHVCNSFPYKSKFTLNFLLFGRI